MSGPGTVARRKPSSSLSVLRAHREYPMTEYVVGIIVAVALVGYLALALAYPERF